MNETKEVTPKERIVQEFKKSYWRYSRLPLYLGVPLATAILSLRIYQAISSEPDITPEIYSYNAARTTLEILENRLGSLNVKKLPYQPERLQGELGAIFDYVQTNRLEKLVAEVRDDIRKMEQTAPVQHYHEAREKIYPLIFRGPIEGGSSLFLTALLSAYGMRKAQKKRDKQLAEFGYDL